MKTIAKGIITLILLTVTVGLTFGQKGVTDGSKYGHGEDSIKCRRNLSMYREYFKQNNYEYANGPWQTVYTECPKASKNIYLDGIKMIQATIKNTVNEQEKEVLLDSMLRIYDQRIRYYKQEAYVTAKKGIDFYKYCEKTPENYRRAYDLLNKALELKKNNAGAGDVVRYFMCSIGLYGADEFDGAQVISDYARVMEVVDYQLKKKPDNKTWVNAKDAIDQLFSNVDVNCSDLIGLFEPKFNETPDDIELIEKIHTMLSRAKCNDEAFYFKVSEKYNTIKPNADLAYELAKTYKEKEQHETASQYYKQAIELEEDSLRVANYYLELGELTYRKLGNHTLAREYALNAAKLAPSNGQPYMLIAYIYIASSKSCFTEDFEQNAVYWLVVDKFAKAKSLDAELAEKANEAINTYSQYFPDNETIFFHGHKEGSTYTVSCWINETTKIRAR